MKKHFLLFCSFFILFILQSCSETYVGEFENEQNTTEIKSGIKTITISFDNIYAQTKYFFYNEKITEVKNSNGYYHKYFYADEKVSKIETYSINNTLEIVKEYTYDNDSLVKIKYWQKDKTSDKIYKFEKIISYNSDKVTTTVTWYDNDDNIDGSPYIFDLYIKNSLINREVQYQGGSDNILAFSIDLEYIDSNPRIAKFKTGSGATNITAEYNYKPKESTPMVRIAKFLFGNEWKMNGILSNQFNLNYINLPEISEDYLLNYKIISNEDNNIIESSIFYYDFYSDNRLKNQTQEKVINNTKHKIEYEYEYY